MQSWSGLSPAAAPLTQLAWKSSRHAEDVGSLWLLQGLLRCVLLSPQDKVDPVEKRQLKYQLRQRIKSDVEGIIDVHRLHQHLLIGAWDSEQQHPHIDHLTEHLNALTRQTAEQKLLKPTWRPDDSLFYNFVKDVHHYVNSVASPESVLQLHNEMSNYKGCFFFPSNIATICLFSASIRFCLHSEIL